MELGTPIGSKSLIEPIPASLQQNQQQVKQQRPEKKGRRVAVIVGYGSTAAEQSARKMDELLRLDNKRKGTDETNFETHLLDKAPILGPHGDIKPVAQKVNQIISKLDDYDSLVVYLCLRKTRWNPNLTPLIEPVKGTTSRRGKQKTEPHKLKNYLLILDLEYHVDLSTDPFHGLPEGVAILTMNGEDKAGPSRNKKYTIFSSFLIEALKGGAADSYGMITLANLFTYLHEACLTEPSWHPTLKLLGSESMLLRRKDGILTKQQIQIFYKNFHQFDEQDKCINVLLKKDLETDEEIRGLLDRLVYLQLIAPCKFKQNEAKVLRGLRNHSRPITCLSEPTLSAKESQSASQQVPFWRFVKAIPRKILALIYWQLRHISREKKYEAYYLTSRGKHLLDMWHHFYFMYT